MRDRAVLRASVAAALVAALVLAWILLPVGSWLVSWFAWTRTLGPWAVVLLVLVWAPAAVLLVPGAVITLATGFTLGLGWGIVVVSLGSTLGACVAFLVGRRLGRERVRARIGHRPRLRSLDRALVEEGFRTVALLRLSPILPYNALNYGLALTGVRLRDFALGSWIGMLPATVLYVWVGAGARSLAAAAAGTSEMGAWGWALFALGAAATVAAVVLVTRAARRALAERTAAR